MIRAHGPGPGIMGQDQGGDPKLQPKRKKSSILLSTRNKYPNIVTHTRKI